MPSVEKVKAPDGVDLAVGPAGGEQGLQQERLVDECLDLQVLGEGAKRRVSIECEERIERGIMSGVFEEPINYDAFVISGREATSSISNAKRICNFVTPLDFQYERRFRRASRLQS